MAQSQSAAAGSGHHPEINWVAAERSPEFQDLTRKRRSFVVPATIFAAVWYFGFIILAGYAPGFMGESVYEGFTVGYALALSQFVMTWVLAFAYVRRADRVFDPLSRKAVDVALNGHGNGAKAGASGRSPTGDGANGGRETPASGPSAGNGEAVSDR